MHRRKFIKYTAAISATVMTPQLLQADFTTKDIKKSIEIAYYASKLNPVRLIAGLIFDEIAEVYLVPLVKHAFNIFLDGGSITKGSLSYYNNSSPELRAKESILIEPYKASIAVFGKDDRTTYSLDRQKKIELELIKSIDKERFTTIHQYFKDNHIKIKLYNRDTISTVGHDLTPDDLFNIDYIAYGKHSSDIHIEKLLKATVNSIFEELVV